MIPTGWELVLLVVVLFVLFGSNKLPAAARSVGQSMRVFKAETKGLRSNDEKAGPDTPAPGAQQPSSPPQQQGLPPSSPPAAPPSEHYQRNDDTSR